MRIHDTVFLDHQATTPVDPRILPRMLAAFGECGNPHSSEHSLGWRAAEMVAFSAARVASLVGADTDEVIFTSGATEANNLALLGLAGHAARSGRHRILLSAIEHKSVLAAGRVLAERHGCEVSLINVDRDGLIDWGMLAAQIDRSVLLVSVMAVNNEIGAIQGVARIGDLAHEAGALFHCDAAQAPCAFNVAGLAEHADLISLSAHKIYGPSGIGALIARRSVQSVISPIIHGGEQQNGLRSGTLPMPLCSGFGAAAELVGCEEMENERERVRACRDLFIEALVGAGCAIELNGPADADRHPGNANLLFRGVAAADLLGAMQPMLAASSGSACSSGVPEPSHVLRAIGRTADEADSSVRFSFGRFTTEDDARQAAIIVSAAVERLVDANLYAVG